MKWFLRIKHLQLRNSLSAEDVAKKSAWVMRRLFSLRDFLESKAVLFYVSIDKEVATHEMIEKAIALGKTVCVPVTSFKDRAMALSRIQSLSELERKPSGLFEPKSIVPFPLEEIDLIIVPGICFDEEGFRLGFGHGFYDRLLKKALPKTKAIGLCFEQNLERRLPRESHDARVGRIVSEERVISCFNE